MLLTHIPFPSPPLKNLSLNKGSNNKASFLDFPPKNKYDCMRRRRKGSCSRSVISCNFDAATTNMRDCSIKPSPNKNLSASKSNNNGIGIINFFQGKTIFITGATGFLGKVLVEKLLRSIGVCKMYLLIKAKDKEAAQYRLEKEIINSETFKRLKEIHGAFYEAFMREKLIVVAGNICELNLGMDYDSVRAIMEEVNVIIQSAAITDFTERYDLMLDANVNGPERLMRFAKACKNLCSFVHVSTAYVNGEREGVIYEEPMTMGENRRKDSSKDPLLDMCNEMRLAMDYSKASSTDLDTTRDLKRLGQQRARLHGWDNTYQLTKAMGEMVINEIKGDIPLLIIRPSAITSCYKEPFPDGYKEIAFDPMIVSYVKGQLPACSGDPEVNLDIIPMDLVVNTIIAATAKHGNLRNPKSGVYHVASSFVNPLRLYDLFGFCYEYFDTTPLIESSKNISKMKFFDNMDDVSKYTRDEIWRRDGLKDAITKDERMVQRKCKVKAMYADQLCKTYEFACFYKARFHNGNTQKLVHDMSEEERNNFEIDATNIDWRKYFMEIHIPGLKKHVLTETAMPIEAELVKT